MSLRSLLVLIAILTTTSGATGASPRIVVLKNGNVLRGTIEQAGDYLRIASEGSELHVRNADVDLISDSLETSYQQLRSRNTPPTALCHLRLASWCIRQELWDEAEIELAAARKLEPNHPRLAFLEQTTAHLRQVAQLQPKARNESNIASTESQAVPPRSADLLAELPKEALEDFTRRIQPILVNSCTTSGCHRVDGPQQFQLNRDLLHGMANRRSTTRNLAATLNLVNPESPSDSELLTRANTAHAGMVTPPLPVHQRELQTRLEEWVLLAAGKKPVQPADPMGQVQLAVGEGLPRGGVLPASATFEPMNREAESVEPLPFDEDLLQPPTSPAPLKIGIRLESWQPRDEFDPELFNRQNSPVPAQP